MPNTNTFPRDRMALFFKGRLRVKAFCELNGIDPPEIESVPRDKWYFDPCAYYRPSTIYICVPKCSVPADEPESRNWNWPGSVTDREPYGVLAHELGHHCDLLKSERKGSYYGNYSEDLMKASGEPSITSYCPNYAEWFAEMFRLFVTNPELLRAIRFRTYDLLTNDWKPVDNGMTWLETLGKNVPARIVRTLRNKGAE